MKQSNWQTTTGSILVLGGLTASTAGMIMVLGQGNTGDQLLAWGAVTALVGTPILTIGLINRHRANRISFSNEPIPIQTHVGNMPRSVP